MARLAIAKDAAIAVGGALVHVITIAGKASDGNVAAASVVVATTLHEASGIERRGALSAGFAHVENLGEGNFGLGLGDGGGRDGNGEDSDESENLGVHCWRWKVLLLAYKGLWRVV